jgi:Ras-related C3 botulinum toxin substrate 1
MTDIKIKAVIAGDGSVGKTCLCISYTQNKFPESYIPTVFDNYQAKLEVNGKIVDLLLWDVSGQEDYKRTRPIAYPDSHVFIICFSLVNPTNLENIESVWIPEIRGYSPNAPFVLVGTKSDLRDEWETIPADQKDPKGRPITKSEGEAFANKIGAVKYIECSAKKAFNVSEVFVESVKVALNPPSKEEKKESEGCCRI